MSDDYSKMFGDEHMIARLHAAVDDWFGEVDAEADRDYEDCEFQQRLHVALSVSLGPTTVPAAEVTP